MAQFEEEKRRIISGELGDLPDKIPSAICIFLSSTFTDYAEERNVVLDNCTAKLRKYCLERGLEYQVADMRWGIQEDAQVDHSTTEQCMREIKNCRDQSLGPYFVTLLGDKYGSRPYPRSIDADEFVTLYRAAFTASRDPKLLDEWYKRDENSVPPMYELQTITSKFPYYNDESDENAEKRQEDRDGWNAVNELLTNMFRAAADMAAKCGRFTAVQKHKYYMSVTENEVKHGILDHTEDASERCLVFNRTLTAIDCTHKLAGRFQDLEGKVPDDEAQDLQSKLKTRRVPNAISEKNIITYTIPWRENGVSKDDNEHAQYLETFEKDFTNRMMDLIDESIEKRPKMSSNKDLYEEVLHQAHFCVQKVQGFRGREDLIAEIREKTVELKSTQDGGQEEETEGQADDQGNLDEDLAALEKEEADKLKDDDEEKEEEEEIKPEEKKEEKEPQEEKNNLWEGVVTNSQVAELEQYGSKLEMLRIPEISGFGQPVIVYGNGGAGKTALLAKLAEDCKSWFTHNPVRLIRFLGTSPKSSTIKETLQSLVRQIWENYGGQPATSMDLANDICFLRLYFAALLHKIDTTEKPLVIVLDAVEKLGSEDYAYTMTWLPTALPPNVHIIVSVDCVLRDCFANVQMILTESGQYFETTPLASECAQNVIESMGALCNRRVTSEQMEYIMFKYRRCSEALYLKLAFEQARSWGSYCDKEMWTLGNTVREAIQHVFSVLEHEHGEVLVARALGYMTASKKGLDKFEMIDILSLDDVVLQNVYLFHLPPNSDLIRLPALLWSRIQHDLDQYTVTTKVDGKQVTKWYYRQFWQVAHEQYVVKTKMSKELHSAMADYFLGTWSDRTKPLELYKKKKGSYSDAMRGVPPQPLSYGPGQRNTRKLNELPFNLIQSGRYEEFVEETVVNFWWLYNKCGAVSIYSILQDIRNAILVISKDIQNRNAQPSSSSGSPVQMSDHDLEQQLNAEIEDDNDDNDDHHNQREKSTMLEGGGGDIFALTEKVEYSKEELEKFCEQIHPVLDMLVLATSACARDANNLPIQILGQLGLESEVVESLSRLRQQAMDFLQSTSIPLLVPTTRCLPAPGGTLLSTIYIDLFFPGDASELEQRLSFSQYSGLIYAMERTRGKQSAGAGDVRKVIDIENHASVKSMEQMWGQEAMWIQLFGGQDRYLFELIYLNRDKYNPKYQAQVTDLVQNKVIQLPEDSSLVNYADNFPLVILKKDEWAQKMKDEHTSTDFEGGPSDEEPELKPVEKPPKPVNAVVSSIDPRYSFLVMGYVYNLERKEEVSLKILAKNLLAAPPVQYGVVSPDGKWVALISPNGAIYTFVAESGKHMYTFGSDEKDKSFSMFNDERHSLRGRMHILPDNTLVCPGRSYDTQKDVNVYDLETGKMKGKLTGQDYEATIVVPSLNGKRVVTGNSGSVTISDHPVGKPLIVYDMLELKAVATCYGKGHSNHWLKVAFCGEEDEFLCASAWRMHGVILYHIGTKDKPVADGIGLPVHSITGHDDDVRYIYESRVLPNVVLLTGGDDNSIKVWSWERIMAESAEKLAQYEDIVDKSSIQKSFFNEEKDRPNQRGEGKISTSAIAVSKDGHIAAVGTEDGWIMFYQLSDQTIIRCEKAGKKSTKAILATSSGNYFVSANEEIKVWNSGTGELLRELERTKDVNSTGSGYGGGDLSCMEEAQDVIVCGYAGMECFGVIWDLKTGQHLNTLQGLYGFSNVAISPDAKWVVTTMFDYPLIYSVESGQPLGDLSKSDTMMAGVGALKISPNGAMVAVASSDGTVRVMTLSDAKYKFRLQHSASVRELAFSPDSTLLVTGSFRSLLVWCLRTGRLLHTLDRHTDFIRRAVFTHDGAFLVTCGADKQIVVWDFPARVSVATFTAHCPLEDVVVAEDLSSVLFRPLNVDYLGVLKPNPMMGRIVRREDANAVPGGVQSAQAYALAFSSTRITNETSRACVIL